MLELWNSIKKKINKIKTTSNIGVKLMSSSSATALLIGDLLIELRDCCEGIGVREHNDKKGGSAGHHLQHLLGQAEV